MYVQIPKDTLNERNKASSSVRQAVTAGECGEKQIHIYLPAPQEHNHPVNITQVKVSLTVRKKKLEYAW